MSAQICNARRLAVPSRALRLSDLSRYRAVQWSVTFPGTDCLVGLEDFNPPPDDL